MLEQIWHRLPVTVTSRITKATDPIDAGLFDSVSRGVLRQIKQYLEAILPWYSGRDETIKNVHTQIMALCQPVASLPSTDADS
jgi:hypothetical protein